MSHLPPFDPTPGIVHVFNRLKTRLRLDRAAMLDLFAGDGKGNTIHIAHEMGDITAWDKDTARLVDYAYELPSVATMVCDTYDQLSRPPLYPRFDIIMSDNYLLNPETPEHFLAFPWVYHWLRSPGILVLLVCRKITRYAHEARLEGIELRTGMKPEDLMPKILGAREAFYGKPQKDGSHSAKQIEEAYRKSAESCNRRVTWTHWQQRVAKTDLFWFIQESRLEGPDEK